VGTQDGRSYGERLPEIVRLAGAGAGGLDAVLDALAALRAAGLGPAIPEEEQAEQDAIREAAWRYGRYCQQRVGG
jgi:hypothetical protein